MLYIPNTTTSNCLLGNRVHRWQSRLQCHLYIPYISIKGQHRMQSTIDYHHLNIATHDISTEVSVPRNETQAFQMGAELLLNITTIMTELAIPISKCILFCDAISTIISYNNHPANYSHPTSKWQATTNIQLYKVAEMVSCAKEDIVLYINQKKTC